VYVALVKANHQGRKTANMAYRWTAESLETLAQDPRELLKLPYAPLDLEYYALREIAADEELTIDYGEEWINAWSSYTNLLLSMPVVQLAQQRHGIKFRHPIIPITGLFPSSWDGLTCVGERCDRVQPSSNTTQVDMKHGEL
jgi:hypothetical protein